MNEVVISKPEKSRIPAVIHEPHPATYEVRTELRNLLISGEISKPFNEMDVLEPMYAIAEQLNPYLESYSLVVADDTSGRLPAILYWRLINFARVDSKQPKAAIRFHSGSVDADEAPLKSVLKTKTEGSRALVVTESVITGYRAMNAYTAAANVYGQDSVDLVAVGLEQSRLNSPDQLSKMGKGSNLFYGTMQRIVTDAYLHRRQGGYRGVRGTEGLKPYSVTLASLKADSEVYRPAVTASRKTATELAGVFYKILRPEIKSAKIEKIQKVARAILST